MNVGRDPYLELPLHGVRLIEASAGTGKTFTLATLVVRVVVERGLRIGQVLAVTFTDAATQELRKRIRERLQLTLDLLDTPTGEDESAETALTRQLLQSHRARGIESDDALRRRLRQATLEIDLAAIFTIHGFCARVLREHALESGHGFDAPALLANDRELRAELAADLWRSHARDAIAADDLAALWPNHDALADDLRALLREPVLLPADAPLPPDPQPALAAAGAALADAQAAFDHHSHDQGGEGEGLAGAGAGFDQAQAVERQVEVGIARCDGAHASSSASSGKASASIAGAGMGSPCVTAP